ncbi:hypothetical protein [Parendozoicomonas haliclonae]|uniref:Lipoprotein n=1 Tax=Parendozoicomonas haliclonae TaxID=1960125 RepID=A0A1X7AHT2_9GAMM|nr:hypothetical protein [Parendozoicomonas haliclonae]SMA43110.1 hypothetical protein EHSB41UT_01556 [Parendozoicomonas haliclonae]
MRSTLKTLTLSALAVATLAGCQSMMDDQTAKAPAAPKAKAVAAQINNDDLYEVAHEGRYYVFDDMAVYKDFIANGETPYRKVYIGEGPDNQTLVFGLTSKDKKKTSGIGSIDLYKGQQQAAEKFYGEMRNEDGRLYVFSTLADMEAVRQTGEAAYRFTQIGAGPNGETVVFVLNKTNKKKKPVALMAEFAARNQ